MNPLNVSHCRLAILSHTPHKSHDAHLPHALPDSVGALEGGGGEDGEAVLPQSADLLHLVSTLTVHCELAPHAPEILQTAKAAACTLTHAAL